MRRRKRKSNKGALIKGMSKALPIELLNDLSFKEATRHLFSVPPATGVQSPRECYSAIKASGVRCASVIPSARLIRLLLEGFQRAVRHMY